MTLLADVVATSRRVADTPSRNAKIAELAALVRPLAPAEIGIGAAYLSGEPRQGRSGIGYGLLRDARPDVVVGAPSLTIAEVDAALERLSGTTGAGSRSERTRILSALLGRATTEERDFLGGLMQPIAPMLAQPANDVAEALGMLGSAAFEWKLDGARVQVHKAADQVRIFTRNRNDVTASAPEIVDALRSVEAAQLILDGEAIALQADGAPHPFQVTMRRFGRTLDVPAMQASLPLSVFFFDCLRHGADVLTEAPLSERFDILSRALPARLLMPRIVTGETAAAQAFYDDALQRGHEGVMAKSPSAPYEAGRRTASWLKIKRVHTLDLVVLAAEWGHGRRKGWLSNLHLAARDEAAGGFVMLGKTLKGMTDEMLAWQTEAMLAREIYRDEWIVRVRPEVVVEIAFNDLQASPHYPGGLALRFARVKRYRTDKSGEDADTLETVRAIYRGRLARATARQ